MIVESNQIINQKTLDLQTSETKSKEFEIENSKLSELANSKIDPSEVKILKAEMMMLKTDINLKIEELRNIKSEHRKEEQSLKDNIANLKTQIPNYVEKSSINFNPMQSSIGKSTIVNDQYQETNIKDQAKIKQLELEIETMKNTWVKNSEMADLKILFDEKNSQCQILNERAKKLANEIVQKDKDLSDLKQSLEEMSESKKMLPAIQIQKNEQLLKELEKSATKSKELESEIEKLNAKIREVEMLNSKVS